MTSSIGSVDRARWMMRLAAAALLSLALMVALATHPSGLGGLGGNASSPAAAQVSAPGGSSAPLDPRIAGLASHHPSQPIEVIVQFKASVNPGRARWAVAHVHGQVIGDLHIINALAVKLTAAQAHSLASSPDIHAVTLNAAVRTEGGHSGFPRRGSGRGPTPVGSNGLETTYDQTLGVTGLWQYGIDGAGVGVAVVDTGIDGNLPDFQGSGPNAGSRVVETAVTNPDATTATDSYGHGTDVAGIIAGDGDQLPPSDPLKGDYIGVAPQANLVSVKVSDESGNATVLDVIYGLQFAIDHQSDYNIRVVNLSLDSQTPQSYKTDPLDAAVEAAWNHGIVVVAAAGNRGGGGSSVQFAPANDPYVITVGAVNQNGTADPSDDTIAPWSSRGTTQDGFQKPDIYAPGADIVSVLAPGSVFARTCLPCLVGGAYINTSGTSMAAPMISGLVADLLQAHPTWTPDQVKGALLSSSVASNVSPLEVDGAKLVAMQAPPRANAGLTPNVLIDPATGGIDYTKSSWSRSSWSSATGALSAGFARSSWSCTCSGTATVASPSSDGVGSSRSSWSRSSWSTTLNPNPANG